MAAQTSPFSDKKKPILSITIPAIPQTSSGATKASVNAPPPPTWTHDAEKGDEDWAEEEERAYEAAIVTESIVMWCVVVHGFMACTYLLWVHWPGLVHLAAYPSLRSITKSNVVFFLTFIPNLCCYLTAVTILTSAGTRPYRLFASEWQRVWEEQIEEGQSASWRSVGMAVMKSRVPVILAGLVGVAIFWVVLWMYALGKGGMP